MDADGAIKFDLGSPFEKQFLCIEATTLGQVTAYQVLQVEVCGSEQISLIDQNNMGTIVKLYDNNSGGGIETVDVAELGFEFKSSRANCPPVSYTLLTSTSQPYTGSDLTVSGTISDIKVHINTLSWLRQEFFYLKVASLNSPLSAKLPLNVTVCGYE
jgi:hypothetical protein